MTYTNENIGVAGFTMIPNELIENMELNGSLLLTMIALYRFKNNQNNSCFPSYQTLSKYARCSRRYVISNMKKLEDMKLVKVSRHDKDEKNAHSSNVYTLLSPSKKQSDSKSSQDDLEAERIVESKDKKRLENQSIVSSELTSPPSELISPELYLSNNTKSNKTNLNKKNIYGMNKNVLFSQEEYEQLKQEFPTDYQERIDRLSNYMSAMGKVYPNHLSTIRLWEDRARQKNKEALSPPTPNNSKSFAYAGTAIPDYSDCKGATL